MLMGSFSIYIENNDRYETERALTSLGYLMGWEPKDVAVMPLEQIAAAVQQHSLLPTTAWSMVRFARMIKTVARDQNAT
jgi:hypothetical protein